MKSITNTTTSSRMVAVALTMFFGIASGTANATVLTFNGWSSSGGGYTTSFFNSIGTTFSDWLDFSLPAGSSGNGASNVISLSFTGNVFLNQFELWDTTSSSLISSGSTGGPTSFLSFSGASVPGSYQLKLGGYSNTSGPNAYAGSIVVSPVPEPQTYAMLLAGLGLMVFSTRRRMNNNA